MYAMFNPYTGTPRHPSDITSDPKGQLIVDPEEPLRPARPEVAIDMVLHCPACGLQHIDRPEADGAWSKPMPGAWTNPPHRSHLCHGCGHIWRPADVPTNGVAAVKTKGKNDSPIPAPRANGGVDR